MDQEQRTTESILNKLKEMVQSKTPVSPEAWIDAALYLQILKFDEQEKRLALEIIANKKKQEIRATTESNADADLHWKTTEEYRNWRRQEDKIKDIAEFIRIAKKEAEILNKY